MQLMKKLFLVIISVFSIDLYGQDLNCEDFKNGTFKAIIKAPFKMEWEIIRKGDTQTELIEKQPDYNFDMELPKKQYGLIEWIDDCTYILRYDETKIALTDQQKLVNAANGVLTELIKIEGNCFWYKATLEYQGQTQRIEGKLCKEK